MMATPPTGSSQMIHGCAARQPLTKVMPLPNRTPTSPTSTPVIPATMSHRIMPSRFSRNSCRSSFVNIPFTPSHILE